ncbi:MAG: hypothetical protein KGQ38_07540 [Actinomycetales bacterium]|nr:hypothetical protein [Actinomycetales bacterium]
MTAIEPKILLITADAASVSDGKINMLGGGWTHISSGPANFTLVARLTIPWTMTNSQLPWSLELIDEDGHLYRPEPGADPVQITAELNVERPDGIPEGSSLDVPLIFPFIGLPLRPGAYEWVFSLAGASAKYAFQVF